MSASMRMGPQRENNDRKTARIVLASFAVIYVFVYRDLLSTGKMFTHDTIIWYGSFQYFIDSLAHGHFPYWDPYMMAGTYFYPSISLLGLLDPAVFLAALFGKIFTVSPLTLFVYFQTGRLLIFAAGAFFLFRRISRSETAAALSAAVLALAIAPTSCRSNGAIMLVYLTPFALFFLLRFLDNIDNGRRYLYLAWFTLATGITLNVYVPAYYLYNIAAFLAAAAAVGIVRLSRLGAVMRDGKLAIALAASLLLVVMMAAPPLAVMLRDASPRGELFPLVRILQKNNGSFKNIDAMKVANDALSEKYYDQRAIYSSYGNMVNLLYPDLLKSFPYWANHDYMSENDQYIGIVALVICILGMLYGETRFRRLAAIMLVAIFAVMFSFSGFYARPHNAVQKLLNVVFPPMKMIEVRESFGSYFLIYLCMLLSLGLAVLFDGERRRSLLAAKYRQLVAICASLVIVKIMLSWYFEGVFFATSGYDLVIITGLLLFALALYLSGTGRLVIPQTMLSSALIVVLLADMFAYNAYFTDEQYERVVLQDSGWLQTLIRTEGRQPTEEFQYFRNPLASPPGLAFGASMLRGKAAFTYGNNDTIFSTKRFYNYYTHIPLQNQLALSGIRFPLLSFIPAGKVERMPSPGRVLDALARTPEQRLNDAWFIEDGRESQPGSSGQLHDLRQYADVPELSPPNLLNVLSALLQPREQGIMNERMRLPDLLNGNESSIKVTAFTTNTVEVAVRNLRAGYLFYLDGWSKYWQAYDGKQELRVYPANYNFKAVFLPPGEHVVRFVFNPLHYRVALIAYLIGLLACCSGIVYFSIVRRS